MAKEKLGVFETGDQGGTLATTITPQQGLAVEDTLTPFVAGLAAEAGMEGIAQHALGEQQSALEDAQEKRNTDLGDLRLKALNEKFDALSVGVSQGLPTAQANTRARAALAETKASVPWIADRADSSFKSFFGGSAGKGFQDSPEEKAIKDYQENVMGVSASMGVSTKTAQTVIQTEAVNDHSEQQLRTELLSQQNNEGAFRNYTNTQQQNGTVTIQAVMESQMQEGNTLGPSGIQAVNATISNLAGKMRTALQKNAFDGEGKPLLTEDAMTKRIEGIDKWATDQKALIGDRSYQSLVKSMSETKDFELSIAGKDMFPVISIINEVGGQAHVQSYLTAIKDPRAVATLVAAQPQLAPFFDKEGRAKQVTAAALAHAGGQIGITDPDSAIQWAQGALTQGGAETSQRVLSDPRNVAVAETIYQQVSNDNPEIAAQAQDYHKKVGKISPSETGRTLSGESFRAIYNKNPDEGFKVVASSVEGMSNNFKSAYLDSTGEIPDYVEIQSPEGDTGFFKATTSDGSPIPEEARVTLSHTYNTLKSNPKYIEEYEKLLGIPLSPADVMELSINGKVHQKFLDRIAAQEAEFKGAVRRDVDKQKAKYEGLNAWSKAIKLLTGSRDPKKDSPWVYMPAGSHMVSPEARQFDITTEPVAPEPQSKLTPEDAEYIKSAPNLEEKVRRAKLMGVPADDVDKITTVALNIERSR